MNLSIVLIDFLEKQGNLKTYRFIPTNKWNRVVVDKLDDIDSDIKGNTDQDVGLLRIYNSDKCELIKTSCKIKSFQENHDGSISFQFEHIYIPIEDSMYGGCGSYNFILPLGYRLLNLSIVDPFDSSTQNIINKKRFSYNIYWDPQKNLQAIQMSLQSRRKNISFIIKGRAKLYDYTSKYLPCLDTEIILDQEISDPFFDRGIKKSFWKNLSDSIILEPNFNGIGIDLKNLFKK